MEHDRMQCEARFWFATGSEVFSGLRVRVPPPTHYCFVVKTPIVVAREFSPGDFDPLQEVRFRLRHYSTTGEVAHYDLDSTPPDGWRWIAVNGVVRAERVPASVRTIPNGK